MGWAAEDAAEARDIVLKVVPPEAVVGTGDSTSVRQIGIVEALEARGNRMINGFALPDDITDVRSLFDHSFWPMLEATLCDVFLTGSNSLTEDGRLVNIDGAGNRVAGMFWGHPTSVLIVGRNKIVKDLDEALDRVKNVIAPEHLRRKGAPTPCTKSGQMSRLRRSREGVRRHDDHRTEAPSHGHPRRHRERGPRFGMGQIVARGTNQEDSGSPRGVHGAVPPACLPAATGDQRRALEDGKGQEAAMAIAAFVVSSRGGSASMPRHHLPELESTG